MWIVGGYPSSGRLKAHTEDGAFHIPAGEAVHIVIPAPGRLTTPKGPLTIDCDLRRWLC
jgi:hypothetical protein